MVQDDRSLPAGRQACLPAGNHKCYMGFRLPRSLRSLAMTTHLSLLHASQRLSATLCRKLDVEINHHLKLQNTLTGS
jgi:hypothetical protein